MVLRLEPASDRNQLSPGSPVGVGIFTERRRRDLSLACSGDCRGIWSVVVLPKRPGHHACGAERDAIPHFYSLKKDLEMLILDRKEEQSVTINGPCIVKVIRIDGNRIKLGFVAKESTKIMRTELIDAKLLEAFVNEQ
jgi:carbon storage regulator CsrA